MREPEERMTLIISDPSLLRLYVAPATGGLGPVVADLFKIAGGSDGDYNEGNDLGKFVVCGFLRCLLS